MERFAEILTNGLASGIAGVLSAPEGAKRKEKIDELVAFQVDLIEKEMAADAGRLKQEVTLAELVSGDRYTRWARPTVVYAGLMFVLVLNVLFPIGAYLSKGKLPENSPTVPTEFWWAWTGVVSAWVLGRSYEKAKGFDTGATSNTAQG